MTLVLIQTSKMGEPGLYRLANWEVRSLKAKRLTVRCLVMGVSWCMSRRVYLLN